MKKYLNVAEKNNAAKNIAIHLSDDNFTRKEGLLLYNKIYEFYAEVEGQRSKMVMTSVSGHLTGQTFVDPFNNWNRSRALELFSAPITKNCTDDQEKLKKTIEREVRSCDALIIWTDCDREGENIGFEIIDVCRAVKSNIPVFRAKFSAITKASVENALQHLETPNKNISDAVDVRQELDLRIGAVFTRFQTLRMQRQFPTKLAGDIVTYGSCQFPTLGFVVEKFKDIQNFETRSFWEIKVIHTLNNLTVDFVREPESKLFDREACQALHETCAESPQANVCDVTIELKSKSRPLPLITVELEKLGSLKLRISAKKTMQLVEKLYTQGLISYPRTETNVFPEDMDLRELVQHQTDNPNWGEFAQKILSSGGPTPSRGDKSDNAHPPIHPVKDIRGLNLDENETQLYELVVRSFLACCYKDAQAQETTVAIDLAGERFAARGLKVTARNYLEVYPYEDWSSIEIHVYERGQTFNPTKIVIEEGKTSPPNLLTEADLIDLMDRNGIGTDATHAEHIDTIKQRKYVIPVDDIYLKPDFLGLALVEGYNAIGLDMSKPHLRAQLEADLKAICEGNKLPSQVLADQIQKYKDVYLNVLDNAEQFERTLAMKLRDMPDKVTASGANNVRCSKCKNPVVLLTSKKRNQNYGKNYYKCHGCGYFQWVPESQRKRRLSPSSGSQ